MYGTGGAGAPEVLRPTEEGKEDLTKEQVQMLRKAFDMFDRDKKGYVHTNMVSAILRTLGQTFEEKDLKELISEIDQDGEHKITFLYAATDERANVSPEPPKSSRFAYYMLLLL
ncbi:hypothetical protein HPB51_021194 [Rhipicephalus microplus]|uniref:EF-hand domain-containing protein n=1 Tax=Rhipicephalus microplus TaxID=6941 RepID=A0A9J6F5T4_RHIMP|nr:hypothetical protein HPB51_021194 [Rhipicephalus microplus]